MQDFFRKTISDVQTKLQVTRAINKATDSANLNLDNHDGTVLVELSKEKDNAVLVLAGLRGLLTPTKPAQAYLALLAVERLVNDGNYRTHNALEQDVDLHTALLYLATKRGHDQSTLQLQRTARRVVLETSRTFTLTGAHPRLAALSGRYEASTGKELVRTILNENKRVKMDDPPATDIRWISPIRRDPPIVGNVVRRTNGTDGDLTSPTVTTMNALFRDPNATLDDTSSPTIPTGAVVSDDVFVGKVLSPTRSDAGSRPVLQATWREDEDSEAVAQREREAAAEREREAAAEREREAAAEREREATAEREREAAAEREREAAAEREREVAAEREREAAAEREREAAAENEPPSQPEAVVVVEGAEVVEDQSKTQDEPASSTAASDPQQPDDAAADEDVATATKGTPKPKGKKGRKR